MPGLRAEVLRAYNVSDTLDKIVDIISSHKHNITESYSAQFDSLMEKIGELQLSKGTLEGDVSEKLDVYARANKEVAVTCNHLRSISKTDSEQTPRLERKIAQMTNRIASIKRIIISQNEDIEIVNKLPTATLIDPRITIAWCRM
ncbi:DNA topoisomerase 1-like [Rosa rugosa]|uniref:DNA topoisomerase 1-like n=1 Tax=Rosa rugosa TaxID=74645 RepID=UPI002B40DB92|nr:DNA topoisomerase 1-like [Rosa rugosa]